MYPGVNNYEGGLMRTWVEQFKPVSDLGWDVRQGQEKLGNSIISSLDNKTMLVGQAECGTGKSLASLIPVIHKIKASKNSGTTPYRAVVSTETITLQNQLNDKDLPFLKNLYGDFTYKKLLGRSNYLCMDRASESGSADPSVLLHLNRLESALTRLQTGERSEVEAITGRLSEDHWRALAGDSEFCVANRCEPDVCFSSKARAEALEADIVVVNHRILAIDSDMKMNPIHESMSNGMFGPVNAIIVDEAHKLEDVMCDHFTLKYSVWEFNQKSTTLFNALQIANTWIGDCSQHIEDFGVLRKELADFFDLTLDFFKILQEDKGEVWEGSETPFCMQFVHPSKIKATDLMNEYETKGPPLFSTLSRKLDDIYKYLMRAVYELSSNKKIKSKMTGKDRKAVRSGVTAATYLLEASSIFDKSMNSKNGIISHMGVTYGSLVRGWRRNDGDPGMSIHICPIDISNKADRIWKSVDSTIFLSATLEDLTSNDFRYFKRSLGAKDALEIKVESPFTMDRQQLIYITNKSYEAEDTTVFGVEEIVESVNATNGRSLILFTSRRDLDMAVAELNNYKIAGRFPYTMLVQTKDADKGKLVEDFKSDDFSVLLGLKSMFTGIDIPGERLSNVIICRFPLSRFSVECRMKINYWRTQGFPNWYERDSLTVFQQACGRLIRSKECIGVVSILDQRVFDPATSVFKTAKIGVSALKSKVTHSFDDVVNHLEAVHEIQ